MKKALCLPLEADFACGGTGMRAVIGEETWKISFYAPEACAGLELRGGRGGDGCELSLDGFVRAAGVDAFPVAKLLVSAVYAANGKGKTLAERDGMCEYTIDETDIMVYYDTESGNITAINAERDGKTFEYRVIR
ncbi:MAG: hypothetical protein J6252_06440 [Clostridia bacterium]|nr:hypothetical protein [Clostridia bacterium]